MTSFSARLLLASLLLPLSLAAQQKPLNDTIAVDKHQYSLFHPTPRKYMRPMVPDRPGVTENPYTVDAGHFQLESDAFRLVNGDAGSSRERDIYLNRVLLKIGLSDKTDLQVGLDSYLINKRWATPETTTPERHARFGDMVVRVKHNLLGDDNSRFALGTIGYVRLPTGHEVGEGGTELGLVVPVVYKLPHKWNVGGQVQTEWNYDRETASHFLLLTPTATIDREFCPWLEGFAELVGAWDTRQASWRASVNLGPQFDVSDNLQFDLGTHLALNKQTDREYFVGFSFRI